MSSSIKSEIVKVLALAWPYFWHWASATCHLLTPQNRRGQTARLACTQTQVPSTHLSWHLRGVPYQLLMPIVL